MVGFGNGNNFISDNMNEIFYDSEYEYGVLLSPRQIILNGINNERLEINILECKFGGTRSRSTKNLNASNGPISARERRQQYDKFLSSRATTKSKQKKNKNDNNSGRIVIMCSNSADCDRNEYDMNLNDDNDIHCGNNGKRRNRNSNINSKKKYGKNQKRNSCSTSTGINRRIKNRNKNVIFKNTGKNNSIKQEMFDENDEMNDYQYVNYNNTPTIAKRESVRSKSSNRSASNVRTKQKSGKSKKGINDMRRGDTTTDDDCDGFVACHISSIFWWYRIVISHQMRVGNSDGSSMSGGELETPIHILDGKSGSTRLDSPVTVIQTIKEKRISTCR